jgi:hypothetical protein
MRKALARADNETVIFAINAGYFSARPTVGGAFGASTRRTRYAKASRNPPAPFLRLALFSRERVVVEAKGLANGTGHIDGFIDITGNRA